MIKWSDLTDFGQEVVLMIVLIAVSFLLIG